MVTVKKIEITMQLKNGTCNRRFKRTSGTQSQPQKNGMKFVWMKDCKGVERGLKNKLILALILGHWDSRDEYTLTTHASLVSLGTFLAQREALLNRFNAYANKSPPKSAKNCSATNAKLFQVVHFTYDFKDYLLVLNFVIVTDQYNAVTIAVFQRFW